MYLCLSIYVHINVVAHRGQKRTLDALNFRYLLAPRYVCWLVNSPLEEQQVFLTGKPPPYSPRNFLRNIRSLDLAARTSAKVLVDILTRSRIICSLSKIMDVDKEHAKLGMKP